MSTNTDGAFQVETTRTRIRGVADAWAAQYAGYKFDDQGRKKEIGKRLRDLDKEAATVADVEAIIGNGSWTRLECDQCGEPVEAVVRFGPEPDYDTSTAFACEPCVAAALDAIRRATGATP